MHLNFILWCLTKSNNKLKYKTKKSSIIVTYHKFSNEVKQEACKDYLASIEPYREGNTYHVPGEFVIGMGMKK